MGVERAGQSARPHHVGHAGLGDPGQEGGGGGGEPRQPGRQGGGGGEAWRETGETSRPAGRLERHQPGQVRPLLLLNTQHSYHQVSLPETLLS